MPTQTYDVAPGLPPSRMEKAGLLVVGIAAGWLLPALVTRLLILLLHVKGSVLSEPVISIMVVSYLTYIPVVWALRHRRHLAIGILISAVMHLLILGSMFLMWWVVRMGNSRAH